MSEVSKEFKIGEKVCILSDPLVEDKDAYLEASLKAKNEEKLLEFMDFQKELIIKLSNGFFKEKKDFSKLKISEYNSLAKWIETQLMGGDNAKN